MDNTETDDDMIMVFSIDETASLLLETGFRKAVCKLTISDRPVVRAAIMDYYCMIKVKASMDQFVQGLQELKIMDYVKAHSTHETSFC